MQTEFIECHARDRVVLQGLLYSPSGGASPRWVIHIHGLAGNFYENAFVHEIAHAITAQGMCLLTINTRGHDYIADLKIQAADSLRWVKGGGAHERFVDCVQDILGAIDFARSRGAEVLVLQGHSSGANKVTFALGVAGIGVVAGAVLLSPCDDIGLLSKREGALVSEDRAQARAMVARGEGERIIPRDVFGEYPLSAATYLADFQAGSEFDVFPYRDGASEFRALREVTCPILVIFGNKGELLDGEPASTLAILKARAVRAPSFDGAIIDGASHSYLGKERELAMRISDWLSRL